VTAPVPATEVSDRAHGTDSDSGSLTGTACAAFSDKRCGLNMRRRTSGATRFTGKKEEGERELQVGLFELRDGLKDGWMLVEGEN
jgi:hypothetical protein